jgi:DnaJ-class molecular chaperone
MDLYKCLNLSKNASNDDIKNSFKSLSKLFHPDKTNNDPIKTSTFKDILYSYSILKDPIKRHHYDLYGHNESDISTDLNTLITELINDGSLNKIFTNFKSFCSTAPKEQAIAQVFNVFNSIDINNLDDSTFKSFISTLSNPSTFIEIITVDLSTSDIIDGCIKSIYNTNINIPSNTFHNSFLNISINNKQYSLQFNYLKNKNDDIYLDCNNNIICNFNISIIEYFCGFNKNIQISPLRNITIFSNSFFEIGLPIIYKNCGINETTDLYIIPHISFPKPKLFNNIKNLFLKVFNKSNLITPNISNNLYILIR